MLPENIFLSPILLKKAKKFEEVIMVS